MSITTLRSALRILLLRRNMRGAQRAVTRLLVRRTIAAMRAI